MRDKGLPLHYLAWAAALMPFVTVHVCYLVAAANGSVEWCMPYWDSCTSISATGRELPEKLLFKFGMIPSALIAAFLWWCARGWVLALKLKQHYPSLNWMPVLGSIAAVFLILYTAALGEEGDAYRQVRRTGVVLSFAFTFLSQLLMTRLLDAVAVEKNDARLKTYQRRLLYIIMVLLATGILSVILDAVMGAGYARVEDAFEWVLALLTNAYFAGLALVMMRYPSYIRIAVN